jgi:hypothetical protein
MGPQTSRNFQRGQPGRSRRRRSRTDWLRRPTRSAEASSRQTNMAATTGQAANSPGSTPVVASALRALGRQRPHSSRAGAQARTNGGPTRYSSFLPRDSASARPRAKARRSFSVTASTTIGFESVAPATAPAFKSAPPRMMFRSRTMTSAALNRPEDFSST